MPAITTKVPMINPADTVHPNKRLTCCSIPSPPYVVVTIIYEQTAVKVACPYYIIVCTLK